MRFFSEYQGPDWINRRQQPAPENYNENIVRVSEIINPNGDKITLGGEETQTFLNPEQGDLKTITRDVSTPLACGCLYKPGMNIRTYQNGQAVCSDHYYICSLCSTEILPQMHAIIPIEGNNSKFFHRHPCAEYVLRQLIQNEQNNPSLPSGTRILLENMYADIRASRSWLYRLFTGRRSNNGLLPGR
jgi:hypothetical protein